MKKIAFTLLVLFVTILAFAAQPQGNGLLWKVSGNGLTKPSYVMGSHHAAPATFVDQVKGFREAVADADAVYGEVNKDELSGAAQQQMMMYAMAPADSTLSKLLSPADMTSLDSLLAIYTGMPGMTAQMEMLKPAVITAQLAVLVIAADNPEMAAAANPLDAVIMGIGEEQGKPTGGLETVETQMQLLFGDPLTLQAKDLMDAVHNNDKLIRQAHDLTAAYLAQDLAVINRITTDPEYGIEPENLDRMLYDRNRAWADELVEMMPQKSVFVVVGAGHLGGDQGLLNLLAKNGYTVECISE